MAKKSLLESVHMDRVFYEDCHRPLLWNIFCHRDIFFPMVYRMFVHVHGIVLPDPLVHIKAIHEQGKAYRSRPQGQQTPQDTPH